MIYKFLTKIPAPWALVIITVAILASIFFAQNYLRGSDPSIDTSVLSSSQTCTFEGLTCSFTVGSNVVKVHFDTPPEPEQPVTVTFSSSDDLHMEAIWIQGVNMYMGKIPVLVERTGFGTWSGWFMLGSCSQPEMRWQMKVHIKGRNHPALLYFASSES